MKPCWILMVVNIQTNIGLVTEDLNLKKVHPK
jgi:hypothetical protein